MQRICRLPTRKINLGIVHYHQRTTCIDNTHIRITIIDVFQCLRPFGITMHLIQIQPCDAMLVGPVNQIDQGMSRKPKVVERRIESLVDILIVFKDVLQKQCCLAHATCSLNSYNPGFPVDLAKEITLKSQINLCDLAMIVVEKTLQFDCIHTNF